MVTRIASELLTKISEAGIDNKNLQLHFTLHHASYHQKLTEKLPETALT